MTAKICEYFTPAKICEYYTPAGRACATPASHISTWNANDEGHREIACCARHAAAIDRRATLLGEPRTMVRL